MAEQSQQLEQLKGKYQSVLSFMSQQPDVKLQNVHIENGKLLIRATASEEAKNRIWDQIKNVDPNYSDLTADIIVQPAAASGAAQRKEPGRTYTVQSGDSLSKISKQFYGDANQYNKIFEANRDQLKDPNKISPGQTLKIPA